MVTRYCGSWCTFRIGRKYWFIFPFARLASLFEGWRESKVTVFAPTEWKPGMRRRPSLFTDSYTLFFEARYGTWCILDKLTALMHFWHSKGFASACPCVNPCRSRRHCTWQTPCHGQTLSRLDTSSALLGSYSLGDRLMPSVVLWSSNIRSLLESLSESLLEFTFFLKFFSVRVFIMPVMPFSNLPQLFSAPFCGT